MLRIDLAGAVLPVYCSQRKHPLPPRNRDGQCSLSLPDHREKPRLAGQLNMNPLREQIRSLLRVEPTSGGFRAMFNMAPALMVLPAHFPDQPIMPGMCMIQLVLIAAGAAHGDHQM